MPKVCYHPFISCSSPNAWLIAFALSFYVWGSVFSRASAQEKQQLGEWRSISLAEWMTADGKAPPEAWEEKEGAIHLRKDGHFRNEGSRGGNIFSRRELGDFDLSFEWRITTGGNSGIKYRVKSYNGKWLGCEYQLFDDASQKLNPKNRCASLYDLYEPSNAKVLHPPGEWNQSTIVVRQSRIEHWLNGERVVVADVGSTDWKKRITESKFNEYESFGENEHGRLMLTDHGSEVWFRNLKIRTASQSDNPPAVAPVVNNPLRKE